MLVSDSDKKSPPMLPALGNVAAVCSYLILCMLSPAPGFLRDVWVSAFKSFQLLALNTICIFDKLAF